MELSYLTRIISRYHTIPARKVIVLIVMAMSACMHEHYVYQWTTSLQVFALDAAFWKGSRRIKAVTK